MQGENADRISSEMPDVPRERRLYMYNSNGDWMDMTPRFSAAAVVDVIAVDVADEDEYFELADEAIGAVVARLVIIEGQPVLLDGAALEDPQDPG
jgi:hypothetical protein